MMVKEVRPNMPVEEIRLTIDELGEVRTFITKWGGEGRVRDAAARDEKGDRVKVSLWNDEVDMVEAGQRVVVRNGYAKVWNGEIQISAGRYGTIKVE